MFLSVIGISSSVWGQYTLLIGIPRRFLTKTLLLSFLIRNTMGFDGTSAHPTDLYQNIQCRRIHQPQIPCHRFMRQPPAINIQARVGWAEHSEAHQQDGIDSMGFSDASEAVKKSIFARGSILEKTALSGHDFPWHTSD